MMNEVPFLRKKTSYMLWSFKEIFKTIEETYNDLNNNQ